MVMYASIHSVGKSRYLCVFLNFDSLLYDSITLILNQPPDGLVLILFGENVFTIDSVQSKVD
jgi:hypothetical protein